ncbi:MAG: hypothetical protein K2L80_08360 [Muribaculaceae bacterium]|nr:hypothetical protein [Muribaculaceae bacterium]MDE6332600.1 hypothetical protein [Muribaculaceae bacterium]
MNIYDRISNMADEPGTYDEKMYRILYSDRYDTGKYRKQKLDEGMEVVNQVIFGWWKPRFLLNHNRKTAYEWMTSDQQLAIVDAEHIDWASMKGLPEEAIATLQCYSFQYPSFIRRFENGIAEVQWQLIPDGRYWRDDEGFGMTDDVELNIFGFIDQQANIISKFRYYTDKERSEHILDKVHKEAVKAIANNQ